MPKKPEPVAVESDDEVDQIVSQNDQIESAPAPAPTQKQRKSTKGQPRTPAQQEAFSKALTILKEKREMKAREEKERYEKANAEEKARIEKEKYEKAKNHKKRLPPAPSYVTTTDLERFKNDLLGAIRPIEKPVEKPVEKVEKPKQVLKEVEPPTPKPVMVAPKVQKPLTGHDLLDKLFFT